MKLTPKSFLTPGQVELAARRWAALAFGGGNSHVAASLCNALRELTLSARGSGDGVAVLVLGREDVEACAPGLSEDQVTALMNRDWSAEMAAAREEMMRAVRAAAEREGRE